MKKNVFVFFIVFVLIGRIPSVQSAQDQSSNNSYRIGFNDVLDISIIKPDKYETSLTVAPDGTINFPYIGNVVVKGATVLEAQEKIKNGLSGRMANPVVLVSLKESRNMIFHVYGEVMKPGSYPINENLTVIEGLSMAGGFSKYASASKVKVMRRRPDGSGNEIMKVNINAAMNGEPGADILIKPGDVITVSEGLF